MSIKLLRSFCTRYFCSRYQVPEHLAYYIMINGVYRLLRYLVRVCALVYRIIGGIRRNLQCTSNLLSFCLKKEFNMEKRLLNIYFRHNPRNLQVTWYWYRQAGHQHNRDVFHGVGCLVCSYVVPIISLLK